MEKEELEEVGTEVVAKFMDVLDIDEFMKKFSQYDTCLIETEDAAKNVLSASLQVRKMRNQIEETRKEIVRPHIDFQKAVMKFAKEFGDRLEKIEQTLQEKVSKWMLEQRENPFTSLDAIEVEDGKISVKEEWQYCIEDEDQIPREYLILSEKLISQAVKSGIRNIPGIQIYKSEETQMRIKN